MERKTCTVVHACLLAEETATRRVHRGATWDAQGEGNRVRHKVQVHRCTRVASCHACIFHRLVRLSRGAPRRMHVAVHATRHAQHDRCINKKIARRILSTFSPLPARIRAPRCRLYFSRRISTTDSFPRMQRMYVYDSIKWRYPPRACVFTRNLLLSLFFFFFFWGPRLFRARLFRSRNCVGDEFMLARYSIFDARRRSIFFFFFFYSSLCEFKEGATNDLMDVCSSNFLSIQDDKIIDTAWRI